MLREGRRRRRPRPGRVDEVLASEEYLDAVHEDIAQARAYGATGVPFFVVDQKYGVSGAQPTEVFSQLLDRAWADRHPVARAGRRRSGRLRPRRVRHLTCR